MSSDNTIRIALAGNPNCGKTTIFNNITGAKQHVGNYPGVTVEKKEGHCIYDGKDLLFIDPTWNVIYTWHRSSPNWNGLWLWG